MAQTKAEKRFLKFYFDTTAYERELRPPRQRLSLAIRIHRFQNENNNTVSVAAVAS